MKHQTLNNSERLVLKHIVRCDAAVQIETTCFFDQQVIAHLLQKNESEKDCSECREKTSSEIL